MANHHEQIVKLAKYTTIFEVNEKRARVASVGMLHGTETKYFLIDHAISEELQLQNHILY